MKYRHLLDIWKNRVPGQLVIQYTDKCNARCPQCGMRVTEQFSRSTLPVDYVKRVIDEAARKGIKVVSFTGGEPLLYLDEIANLATYAGAAGIEYIRTGTNGFLLLNSHRPRFEYRVAKIAEKLADTPIRNLWISVDSAVPETHESMRGFPGIIAGIEKAIPVFHSHGIYPSANLGVNRNIDGAFTSELRMGPSGATQTYLEDFYATFRSAFRKFYQFVSDLGFTMVNACYPMSINEESASLNPVYAATSIDRIISFTNDEKAALFRALFDTIPEFRSKIRIFSPRSSLYAMYKSYEKHSQDGTYGCRGGADFFFLDSKDGAIYPCGYRGQENLGTIWDLKPTHNGKEPDCRQCDWECFRDPSELFGPILDAVHRPHKLINKWRKDKSSMRVWIEDMRYYRACDLFDGRTPPDFSKLSKFRSQPV